MRLWSLHPKHLDRAGLIALWREALLAQAVLRGDTLGYRHHPQLDRFREQHDPRCAISSYLRGIHIEAIRRDYNFDETKIGVSEMTVGTIDVPSGQIALEREILKSKLETRSPDDATRLNHSIIESHPIFRIVAGDIAPWERAHQRSP